MASTYHHGDIPTAIVDAALARLDSDDLSSLSLRLLSRDIGVSAAAVYRHFADKAELVGAIAQRGFALLTERFREQTVEPKRRTKAGARAHLERLATAYLRFARDSPALFRLMFGREAAGYRSSVLADPRIHSASFSFLERALLLIHEAGLTPRQPSESDAMAAWALVHGYSMLILGGVDGVIDNDLQHLGTMIAERIIKQCQ